jgi:hypothetical protein
MARKRPKRSRIETRRIEPSTTERMRVRYSPASPVCPDQRAAARITKNAEPATISLKYSAKPSTTNPPPKKLPENPMMRSTAALPNTAREPRAARPATSPMLRSANTPTMRTRIKKPVATSSGRSARKASPVTVTSYPLSR